MPLKLPFLLSLFPIFHLEKEGVSLGKIVIGLSNEILPSIRVGFSLNQV